MTVEEKGEPKRGIKPTSSAHQPNALPLGQTVLTVKFLFFQTAFLFFFFFFLCVCVCVCVCVEVIHPFFDSWIVQVTSNHSLAISATIFVCSMVACPNVCCIFVCPGKGIAANAFGFLTCRDNYANACDYIRGLYVSDSSSGAPWWSKFMSPLLWTRSWQMFFLLSFKYQFTI